MYSEAYKKEVREKISKIKKSEVLQFKKDPSICGLGWYTDVKDEKWNVSAVFCFDGKKYVGASNYYGWPSYGLYEFKVI